MSQKFHAGHYIQQNQYKSFSPGLLVGADFDLQDKMITVLLEKAVKNLGELNAYSKLVPNVDFFIQMYATKEAVTSSKIEGTKTEIDDILSPEEDVLPEKRDDRREVQNYIDALNQAIDDLEDLPFSTRLLKNTHKTLLSGVRGERKTPGEIRISQNWIGGSSPSDAFFVPPHHEDVSDILSDLENFWHNKNSESPILIKIAVMHYQFETIHPFLDGNGRIGRLAIVLQLIESEFLSKPTLYLSDFFERNKGSYYESLTMVRQTGKIEQWIKFFLNGVVETAEKSKEVFAKIIDLREKYENKIMELGSRARDGKELILNLFADPIMSAGEAAEKLGVSYNTANNLMLDFVRLGILEEVTGQSRNRMFVMHEYLSLFKN